MSIQLRTTSPKRTFRSRELTRVYVGNLSSDTSEQDIETAFAPFGSVETVAIIRDRNTGRSRGFGFVEMSDPEEASAAIAGLNGQELSGRTVTVNEARPRSEGRGDSRRDDHGGGGGRRW